MKTCNTCGCNKVCDHNIWGFETCGNYVSEQIIRKQSEVSDYWQKNVKQYRTMKGYSDIEHDVDNFLRGYNEAVEDILAILDGTSKERGGENETSLR